MFFYLAEWRRVKAGRQAASPQRIAGAEARATVGRHDLWRRRVWDMRRSTTRAGFALRCITAARARIRVLASIQPPDGSTATVLDKRMLAIEDPRLATEEARRPIGD